MSFTNHRVEGVSRPAANNPAPVISKGYAPTKEQQSVIDFTHGHAVTSACPGSGKTQTLINRCKALSSYEDKLVLAFNKRAAEDFKDRLGNCREADVKTFHAFCLREVMNNYQKYGFSSKPNVSSANLLSQMREANGLKGFGSWEKSGWNDSIAQNAENSYYEKDVDDLIERNKLNYTDDEFSEMEIEMNALEMSGNDPKREWDLFTIVAAEDKIRKIRNTGIAIREYRKWLILCNMVSFASMIRIVAEQRHNLSISAEHIMVDEFQDVDRFQFDIITALGRLGTTQSLVAVGDPNQCIYKWRGALENAFMEFEEQFNASDSFRMTMNFRSYDEILNYADRICYVGMKGVRGSKEKSVIEKPGAMIEELTGLIKKGVSYANNAILCRYNRDAMKWMLSLAKDGVPVYQLGKGDFWNSSHTKLIKKFWTEGKSYKDLLDSKEWVRMMSGGRFIDDEDAQAEAADDAFWILRLTKQDMIMLDSALQNERDGVRVSTVHKTKGMEWDNVMVYGADKKFRSEREVFYVACTRAKNFLIIS